MKKVLVATCVVAMTAFGITNASAQTTRTVANAQSARALAFGLELNSSLLDGVTGELLDRTGEAESVLPPGGPQVDDLATVGDAGELAFVSTGSALADTRVEPTIRPILNESNEQARGGEGEGSGLLGQDLLGGGLIGGDEGFLGGLLGGGDEGTVGGLIGGGGGEGTVGGLAGGILSNSEGEAATVEAQQGTVGGLVGGGGGDTVGGLVGGGGGGEGLIGSLVGGGLIAGLLDDGEADQEGNLKGDIVSPVANAQAYTAAEGIGLASDEESLIGSLIGGGLTDVAARALVEALLKVEAVQAEAIALCTTDGPFYDAASRILDVNDDPLSLVDNLISVVQDLGVLDGIVDLKVNERVLLPNDQGIFVNALRLTILGGDDGSSTTSTTSTTLPISADSVSAQQVDGIGGDGPLLELIVGHAEVTGAVCAQADTGGDVDPLPPAGDERTLPVTGGGLGILPGFLAFGLVGGAVAAGRVALRSRREHTL